MAQKRKRYPSQERLRELFDYDPEKGLIRKFRKEITRYDKTWNKRWAGTIADTTKVDGVSIKRQVMINCSKYSYLNILWIYFYGDMPRGRYVKSKSGLFGRIMPSDLFLCESMYQKHNGNLDTRNSHGYKGVRVQRSGRYQAVLDSKDLGTYQTAEAAAEAWNRAAIDKYGSGFVANNTNCTEPEKFRVTLSQDKQSRRMSSHKYKGVMPNRKNWMARIGLNGKLKYLGTFKDEEQAARAYNKAAYEHYGEHAVLNDIPDPLGLAKPEEGDAF